MPPASVPFPGPTPRLCTDRLTLEPFRATHSRALFEGLSDPALFRHLAGHPPADLAAVSRHIALAVPGRSPDGADLWCNWMIRRHLDGCWVGTVQGSFEAAVPDCPLIGVMIFPPFWRQGIGAEAVACMLDCLFDRYDARAAEARVDTRNAASLALLAGLGFQTTGLFPDADFFGGRTSHEFALFLDRARWRARSITIR